MPTSSRRRSSKLAAAPLDLDEIEQDPGFRGMLSFLEISPEEKLRNLALRHEVDRQSPMGELPMGQSTSEGVIAESNLQDSPGAVTSEKPPETVGVAPTASISPTLLDSELPMGQLPMGQLDSGRLLATPAAIPVMDVEGRGKRPLRYCRTVQDGHTSSEEIAYQTLWAHARRHGETDVDGSQIVDLALSQLRTILKTDHKNVKRLLTSLRSKLNLEVVRPPDYRRAISTRYRIFSPGQVLERRKNAQLVWVVRTRAVRFVPADVVNRLVSTEQPMGN